MEVQIERMKEAYCKECAFGCDRVYAEVSEDGSVISCDYFIWKAENQQGRD